MFCRLQVSVDDSLLVRLFESLGDLARERQGLIQGKGTRLEPLRQGRALDQLHDERACSFGFLEPEDRRDVRMVELGEQLRLALEPRQPLRVLCERRRQHLDRHLALEPGVGRPVDLPHSAFANFGGDLVAADLRSDQDSRAYPAMRAGRRESRAGEKPARHAARRGSSPGRGSHRDRSPAGSVLDQGGEAGVGGQRREVRVDREPARGQQIGIASSRSSRAIARSGCAQRVSIRAS